MHKRLLLVTSAVAACLAFAACGDSDTSAPTSAGSSSEEGPAIKVGFICSCSGAASATLAPIDDTIKAWGSSVNANGGINGHPVEVIVKDDANDPAKAVQAAKDLAASNVVAIIDGSLQDQAFAKQVASAGIPVTGGQSATAPFFTDPNFFPSGAVLPPRVMALVQQANDAGKKQIQSFYCSEAPVCAQVVGLMQAGGAAAAPDVALEGTAISMTAPKYTAPCLAAKDGGADALFTSATGPVVQRVAAECKQQQFEPLQVNMAETVSPVWLKDPSMDGTMLIASQAPWFDTSVPGVKTFTDALQKYAPDVINGDQFGPNTLAAWSGGQLFAAAAKAAELTPSSGPDDVKAGLYKLKNETLDGITGPLTFTKDQPAFPACYGFVQIKDGKFTAPQGAQPICPPADQVSTLATALAKAG